MKVLCFILMALTTATAKLSVDEWFRGCDQSHTLRNNQNAFWLESSSFPKNYLTKTACRYKVTAPLGHKVQANCTKWLPKEDPSCTTDILLMSREGNADMDDAIQICGNGTAYRESTFGSIVLAYVSNGESGRFKCKFTYAKQYCQCGWSINTRIQNGQEVEVHNYPSMVGLRDLTNKWSKNVFCGGTILSHSWILTGAQCTRMQPKASNLEAIVGAHNLNNIVEARYAARHRIAQIIEHPDYKSKPVVNDIALLKTATSIEWSRGVGPICLPQTDTDLYEGKYADLIGWGSTFFGGPMASALRKVTLKIIPNSYCQRTYGLQTNILPSHLCTKDDRGTKGSSCSWDAGGPVILSGRRQVLAGVISFGNDCNPGDNGTGVNTRITSFLSWIKQHVDGLCPLNIKV